LIGGADVVIDADAGHSFNPGFKFQPRRADAPQVQHDLEDAVRLLRPKVPKPRDIYVPDLHIDRIKVKTRDFR